MDILAREKAKRRLSAALMISKKEANAIMDRMVNEFKGDVFQCKRN